MRRQLPLLPLLFALGCGSGSEPTSFNAGRWESLPVPSGATEVFSLDTSGTLIRGEGEYGGFVNQPAQPLLLMGRLAGDSAYLVFRYADGSTQNFDGVFATPTRLQGTVTRIGRPPVPSVVYLRH